MTENIPVKNIPLPDYLEYKNDIISRYAINLPLPCIPFSEDGNLNHLPPPMDRTKTGWPWTVESEVKFLANGAYPKISVVVPSYQQGTYIEETIRSVILQNYPNLELIIMDGGSSDTTNSVLQYYDAFISLSVSEKDRGQSHAINKGFAIATGELYYWLNSDDYLNKNSLNHIVPYFMDKANLAIVYGHGIIVDPGSDNPKFDYAPLALERYLRFGGIILSHSVIWRSSVHQPIWEDLQCAMDAELWLRLFTGKKSKHSQFPIGIFRRHPQQKTSVSVAWAKQWQQDFENYIWKYYRPISKTDWKFRLYEYRLVQKLYRLLNPQPQNER